MKNLKFIMLTWLILFSISFLTYAQQDYQIVHNFNAEYQQIQQYIKTADSLTQLTQLEDSISTLKKIFLDHKELLDKSLYPYDFNGAIANLDNALALRKKDFTKISTLQTQVIGLTVQIDTLNKRNSDLLDRIQLLEIQSEKDEKTIKKLKKNISNLIVSLHKRDGLIMSMLDSLMPPEIREKTGLSKSEKQKVYSEAKKQNVISNIKRAIEDNIKFLEVTTLNPTDINNIKKQERQFEMIWNGMASKFTELYSEKRKRVEDITEINAKFAQWKNALQQEAWNSIKQEFADHNVILNEFHSGDQFTNVMTMYINDEIKNAGIKQAQSKTDFELFADTLWFGIVKPKWVPYLTDNQMLTVPQKNLIEARLTQWSYIVKPNNTNWWYIIIAILVVGSLVIVLRKVAANKKQTKIKSEAQDVKKNVKKSEKEIQQI